MLGCAKKPPVTPQRLPDGRFAFKCDSELWVCLSNVKDLCRGGPYAVDGAWDQATTAGIDQTRVETHRSEAVVRCLHRGQDPRRLFDKADDPTLVERVPPAGGAKAPSLATATTTTTAARACVPGATQACVGPAACAGGQSCLPDGSGFGQCDCGAR
ncbi:MAG TPA: hypothetical protein VFZ53_33820 [Polyangiaceae bacterium]